MSRRTPRTGRRIASVVGGSLLVIALALTGTSATAAPGDEHLAGLEYVALGDSYAAGYGILPSTGSPVVGCDQSTSNYPHLTAAELGLTLTDVTCSGAETGNVTTIAQVTYNGTAPIQLTALGPTTNIVTLTIGGNDLGFVDILTNCAYAALLGGVVAGTPNCAGFYAPGGVDSLAAAITGPVSTALDNTLAAIALAAPSAKIFVVGYPALTPSTLPVGGCFVDAAGTYAPPFPVNAYPYQDVDVSYLHTVEVALDSAMSTTSTANGAVYISNLAGSDAHSPCATVDPYVNGITISSITVAPALAVTLEPGAMHPNSDGAEFLAANLNSAIRAAFPAPVVTGAAPALAATGATTGGIWLLGVVVLLTGALVLGWRRRLARE